MKLTQTLCCLLLLSFSASVFAQSSQSRIRIGNKIGTGIGKFKPIVPLTSDQYQRPDILGLCSVFLDSRIKESKFYVRYELGVSKLPTPSDYLLDLDASISTQLLWQGQSGWAFGAGLRAALLLSITGETSLFVYQRSTHEFAIPLTIEKHWALGQQSAVNIGMTTTASLTRVFGDCLWWDDPFNRPTSACIEQTIRGGLMYVGFIYKLK
ncbi:MAG: hypothetical protein AAFN10_03805 [Bacteroidota bacterium]